MRREDLDPPRSGAEPFPVDDPVAGSVLTEDWGRMAERDEGLEGTLADVPQTGEPHASDAPAPPPESDKGR